MFKNIFIFELHQRFRKASTHFYFIFFLILGFSIVFSLGKTTGNSNVYINAPFRLFFLIVGFSNIGLFMIAEFFGNAGYKDFKENVHGVYFSYPVTKYDYILGRFAGAYVSALYVFSGLGIGAFFVTILPLFDPDKIGPVSLYAYIQPYIIGLLPNLLFSGALFFTMALLTRKIFPVYLGLIILISGYMLGAGLIPSFANNPISPLLDPFGILAFGSSTYQWTAMQKNVLFIPFSESILANRILWSASGIGLLIFAYLRFELSYLVESKKSEKTLLKKKSEKSFKPISEKSLFFKSERKFDFKTNLRQVYYSSMQEFNSLVRNTSFQIILLIAVILMFGFGYMNVGVISGTQSYPVTYRVLDISVDLFYLFFLIIIIFCSGELIWRERDNKVNELYDSIPMPNWVPLTGKLGALILIQILLALIIMICGIVLQTLKGYYNYELSLYLKELFGIRLVFFTLVTVSSLLVHVVIHNKHLGHFLSALVFIMFIDEDILPSLGFEHNLYRFASTPHYIYSDMNGYGHFAKPLLFFNLYWCSFAVLLIVLAALFWVRGNDTNFKHRLSVVKTRITKGKILTAGVSLVLFILFGGYIYYNTNILNTYTSAIDRELISVDYERKYKRYEDIPRPNIIDINVNVDIFPEQRRFVSNGKLILKNKTESDITEIFVQLPREVELNKLNLDAPCVLQESSSEHGVYIFKLDDPLTAQKEISLLFELEYSEQGFANNVDYSGYLNLMLVNNGTLLDFLYIAPTIHYPFFKYELQDNKTRKKYGLVPQGRIASINDEKSLMESLNKDADWINLEAVISTSGNQTALTSGELLRQWTEQNRNFFHYKAPVKISSGFPVMSGQYTIKKDKWKTVSIEIYYQKGHEYNIDLMIDAVKKSLTYYTQNFSEYPFNNIKIVEYPRYKTGAEAYATIIPFSEGYGFISKLDKNKVEYVFRVAAHEVAHQWWGEQVIGARLEGMFFLMESMPQYSALMVIRREYSKKQIADYMKEQIDIYLRKRSREKNIEVPLSLTNLAVPYINYNKGIAVMNALQDYIGEDSLNTAIRNFIKETAYRDPPFPTSIDFLGYVKEVTPDSLMYIFEDLFETITLYDNQAVHAQYSVMSDGRYLVELKYSSRKLRSSGNGTEKETELHDSITFGVFGENNNELYLAKHWVYSTEGDIQFIVNDKPYSVGIDPYYYLLDKKTENNIINVN